MEKEQDPAVDVDLTDQLFDVTTYIYVDIVLEKWPRNWVSKNMSSEEDNDGHADKWIDNDHKQRNAQQT
jgi:hypothetical protein